ncbi:very-long-chain (3R)-3-hydroxyacyl-CoA dehydratase-like [Gigantopelta aegis]|uniref:very-long-chain (3R)-3-hydroxyacyl-CoA dehydratase-like n=1 Tax=Gigantopelta aegis TaxID=1735272 RepID=UPI001B88D7B5|nr:very-long-chain (3R)-3-hydroxyacyl-CoA dehydratase-like [Gigantopelta aegis]
MADTLSPFVLWGQKSDYVTLKVELREVMDEDVDLTDEKIKFTAQGVGVKGNNKYSFEIDFYLPVDPEKSKYRVTPTGVEIRVEKGAKGEVWPRLTEKPIKLPWLKIDFDKVMLEDDSEEEHDDGSLRNQQEEMLNRIENDLMKDPESAPLDYKRLYLFLYNMFQFVGYSYIVFVLQYRFYKYGEDDKHTAFETVGSQVMVCQFVAVMEIVHPLLGLVKSGFFAPFAQVFGRNFILFVLLLNEPRLHTAPAVWYLFVVWCAVEMVRYPYYMLNTLGKEIDFITWLRYTVWIPLYPLGFLLEGTIVIMSIPLFTQTEKLSVHLPNSTNFAFYFPWLLHGYLALLAIAAYKMMNYMYLQRKKKLGIGERKKTK